MNRDEIRQLIMAILTEIAPETEDETVDEDEDLRDALDLDSMDFLKLITTLSKRCSITIPEQDYQQVTTLSTITDYLQKKGA